MAVSPVSVPAPAPAPAPAPTNAPVLMSERSLAVKAPLESQAVQSSEQEVPIALGLNTFLENPKAASVEEMGSLRDGLIQILGMLTQEISQRPTTGLPSDGQTAVMTPQRGARDVASMEAAERITSINSASSENDIESELRVGLGLLLKHRGGPGFGHGRLEGVELDSLENRLRSITKKLREEVMA